MTAWTSNELERIASADELRIAFQRPDGTLASPRTIWVVRDGDDLYVRSVNGRTSAWFRGTQASHQGHVEAGGVSKDVTFTDPEDSVDEELDAAYRAQVPPLLAEHRQLRPHRASEVRHSQASATLKLCLGYCTPSTGYQPAFQMRIRPALSGRLRNRHAGGMRLSVTPACVRCSRREGGSGAVCRNPALPGAVGHSPTTGAPYPATSRRARIRNHTDVRCTPPAAGHVRGLWPPDLIA